MEMPPPTAVRNALAWDLHVVRPAPLIKMPPSPRWLGGQAEQLGNMQSHAPSQTPIVKMLLCPVARREPAKVSATKEVAEGRQKLELAQELRELQ